MAITTAVANSYKQEVMRGQHVFTTTGFTLTASSSSSTTFSGASDLTGVTVGMSFTGTNVGANSIVTALGTTTTFTSSVAATGTIAGGTLTFTNPMASQIFLALYTSAATLNSATTSYTASNEASGVTAGGYQLTFSASMPSLSSGTALMDYADLVISSVSTTARGCLIYNKYGGHNRAITIHDFGADKTATSGDFTVVFPAADSSNAILRLA